MSIRVVRFDEPVEKCLLGLMPFVGTFAKTKPIDRGRLSLPCANMVVPSLNSILRNETDWAITSANPLTA